MNNNYENSNYLYNYYDINYYNSFNDTNDQRMDSLYENYPNFYPNIDCKIASNIASNYRQYNTQWLPNYGWTPSAPTPYYEPNCMYNNLEPFNSYQTPVVQEVDPYHNHNHIPYPLTDIQSLSSHLIYCRFLG